VRLLVYGVIAVAVAATTTAAGYGVAHRGGDPVPDVLGPEPITVVIDIEHSSFSPSALQVEEGTEVRFVVRNHDPINHELIVGPPEVHARHSTGTEETHPPVPGEVSVGALRRGVTSYTFDTAGTVEMACHLPGHRAYGMRGAVEVLPPAPQT
jgi:uncharacterized cupredoxin-like copper-binding protein